MPPSLPSFSSPATFRWGGVGRYPTSPKRGVVACKRRTNICFTLLFFCTLSLSLTGCKKEPEASPALRVAIRPAPATYQAIVEDGEGATGFEYELLKAFAASVGRPLQLNVVAQESDLYRKLSRGEADMAAGWLNGLPSPPASSNFLASPPLHTSRLVLVQHETSLNRTDASVGQALPLHVTKGTLSSAGIETLRQQFPSWHFQEWNSPDEYSLLGAVAEHQVERAVVDETHFRMALNTHPTLRASPPALKEHSIVWLLHSSQAKELLPPLKVFLSEAETHGMLARLRDKYFDHINQVEPLAIVNFLEKTRSTLPKYHQLFKDAQIRTEIDWRLIAAISYQESGWNPLATSPTGVRGMMMLTEDTADHLGVKNRLDPRESIVAGARYLAEIRDSLPEDVLEPDRTWIALAGYNLGMGHLKAGRHIAESIGKNSRNWYELKQALPLLARPEYYQRLKSGRGRGGEAVILVENIRTFYDILQRYQPPYSARTGEISATAPPPRPQAQAPMVTKVRQKDQEKTTAPPPLGLPVLRHDASPFKSPGEVTPRLRFQPQEGAGLRP